MSTTNKPLSDEEIKKQKEKEDAINQLVPEQLNKQISDLTKKHGLCKCEAEYVPYWKGGKKPEFKDEQEAHEKMEFICRRCNNVILKKQGVIYSKELKDLNNSQL